MNIITAVDIGNGVAFNNRRQSRDSKVTENIKELTEHNNLWIQPYSRQLFDQAVLVEEECIHFAAKDDFCFLERQNLAELEDQIHKLILYCWNRDYPADIFLGIDLHSEKWFLEEELEFEGNSHERITRQIWSRHEG